MIGDLNLAVLEVEIVRRSNSKLDAAVHIKPWHNEWEAPYPDNIICLSNQDKDQKEKNYNSSNKKKDKKAPVTIGERVRSIKNGRTAVIIESTIDKITVRYDDGSIESFGHKKWVKETPFLSVKNERK